MDIQVGDWVKYRTATGQPSRSIVEIINIRKNEGTTLLITEHGSFHPGAIVEVRRKEKS
jgi:hypothetical protein